MDQRVGPADTCRYLDDYLTYRFGHPMSPADFAKQAGVQTDQVEDLFAQKQIPDDVLQKIARSIDVSKDLLSAIAGYQPMDQATKQSLDQFFRAVRPQKAQQARAA
jgi:plasmid maintenance system antidote protein VapI